MTFSTENFLQKEQRQISFRRLFRRVFVDDWVVKALALAITFALWLGVTGLRTPTRERLRNISLAVRVSNDIEITNSPVQEVDLVVTGDKRKIDQIKREDLVVSLDLTDAQPGDRTVKISPENVNVELPTGIKLEEVQPNKIAVKLEQVEEREISVKADTEGSVADGFEIYSETVLPNKIKVRGPSSYVRSLDSVSTEKINLDNHQADFTVQQVGLNLVNPKVTLIDTVVDVIFRIGEKRIERLFLVPVKTDNKGGTATVVLYGVRSVLDALRSENLQVEITNDVGENSLRLVLPAEIQGKVEIRKLKIN